MGLERDLGDAPAPVTSWAFPGVDGCQEVGLLQPRGGCGESRPVVPAGCRGCQACVQ